MTIARESTSEESLRLWPGVVAVGLQWLLRFVVPAVVPETLPLGMMAGLAGGLAVVVWWAFFSRATRPERVGAVLLMVVALAATPPILHESVATGMMGLMFFLHAIPVLSLAFVVWALVTRGLPTRARHASMVATIVLACGGWALARTGGMSGEGAADLGWRWSKTPEERLVARAVDEPGALRAAQAEPKLEADWPGFRGRDRDSVVHGAPIDTDWSRSPPVELWRRPIGPGWSSFAVRGDLLYTQEQLGEDEVVACYRVSTGEPVWRHRDAARFWESNAGAGPRATPTLQNGRVYTLGATGILNALDAADGSLVWSREPASDTGKKVPGWGFSSSPLVVGDVVIVATAGVLVAYDAATGERRWLGPSRGWGYSSPHLATIGGVAQVLLLNGAGAISVAPTDGTLLWEHAWSSDGIVQPALTADGDVLLGSGSGLGSEVGVRRIAVGHSSGGWTVEERWTSTGLKPYFNDFVIHDGHAFGFDGGILACIDLVDGKRAWKGGRYGHGQLLLLPEQHVLLVLSEQGELALVGATPEKFTELARLPALSGKTWNHPVLVGDVLLLRNGEEIVALRLPLASAAG